MTMAEGLSVSIIDRGRISDGSPRYNEPDNSSLKYNNIEL